MIEPTAKECNPCHFNVDSKCYKPCNHIKSEFARLENENEALQDAIKDLIELHEGEMDRPAVQYAIRVLKNAKS